MLQHRERQRYGFKTAPYVTMQCAAATVIPEEDCRLARINAQLRMNFFPLPDSVAERIGQRLVFQPACSVLDPCAGEGRALVAMTRHAPGCRRYGVELDAYRTEEAAKVFDLVIQGDALNTRSKVESFSLVYCNPPFDFEQGEHGGNQRMEKLFTAHVARWLVPAGILVLVVPVERLADCVRTLAYYFTDVRAFRLEAPECERYRQIVVFAKSKTRREREKSSDHAITSAQLHLASLARDPARIAPLSEADVRYIVPPSGPAELIYEGWPLDVIEDLLPASPPYRQLEHVLNPKPLSLQTRPVTPLHKGHIGPIRRVADFCCKCLEKGLLFRWLHSIVKMFYLMCCRSPLVSSAM